MPKSTFRVIEAGPWDAKTFGVVDVEVTLGDDGLEARIQERGGAPIEFTIDDYQWLGDVVVFRTNAARKWIFQALP